MHNEDMDITMSQVGEILGIDRTTALRWVHAGKLPFTRRGNRFVVDELTVRVYAAKRDAEFRA
jgi:excisionase family DNA binding protein